MPRPTKNAPSVAKVTERRLLWQQTGEDSGELLTDWDPKTETLVNALLEIVATGASVFIRPGSGGRAIGIAIWEGEDRHKPTWVYEASELDGWAEGIMHMAKQRRGESE
jgi:hypothetical protein